MLDATVAAGEMPHRLAYAVQILVLSSVAAPLFVIVHELAHWLMAPVFGYDPGVFWYGGAGGVPHTAPAWQQAMGIAAGPAISLLLVGGAYIGIRLYGARPILIAAIFAAGVRAVGLGLVYFRTLFDPSLVRRFRPDEIALADRLSLPLGGPLLLIGVLLTSLLWVLAVHHVPRGVRTMAAAAAIVGAAVGFALYLTTLGPLLFPFPAPPARP